MGIIAGVLFTVPAYQHLVVDESGALYIPFWIVLMAHTAIALGTLSGGWRIVHTVGSRITRLVPMGGFAAETAGAVTLFVSSHFGIPVSTTHTITGAIMGVGAVRRMRSVRWTVARQIMWVWVLTIPVSAALAGTVYLSLSALRSLF
jgi:PiT family inorganic phosphate transporter